MAKIPSIFQKKYTEKSLNKKILKKVYIQDDLKFVKSLFKKTKIKDKDFYLVDSERTFNKNELKRLKLIAKQIKKQKGRIKFLPLIAVVSVIVVISFLFITTKNFFIKKVAKSYLEYTFESKCEIQSVNLKLLDSSLSVKGFSIANKANPMENLFSFDGLTIDFNLAQLMRKKIIAEDLSIEEFAFHSTRTTDGSLSEKQLLNILKKKNKKLLKQLEQQTDEDNAVYTYISENSSVKKVQSAFLDSFSSFNPQAILEENYNSLETLATTKKIQEEVASLNDKWKDTPSKITENINSLKKSTDSMLGYDYASIQNNPTKITELLQNIKTLTEDLNKVKSEVTPLVTDVKTDFSTVTNLSKELQTSITADKNQLGEKLSSIKNFSLSSSNNLISSTIESLGYSLLGKYYPYIKKGIDYLSNMKKSDSTEKTKTETTEKKTYKRLQGTNINFTNDIYPSLWIKKISASGYNAKLTATNISSDMTKINQSALVQVELTDNKIVHKGSAELDTRRTSTNPLLSVDYTGSNIPFKYTATEQGIPSISTVSDLSAKLSLSDDKTVSANGKGSFKEVQMSSLSFEPEYAFNIYNSVLSQIKTCSLAMNMAFSEDEGIKMNLSTDADTQIRNSLSSKLNAELSSIKKSVEEEFTKKLSEMTSSSSQQIDSFTDIYKSITESSNSLADIESQIQKKQAELQSALLKGNTSLPDNVQQNTNSLLNGLKDLIK